MVLSTLLRFIYPPPASLFITAMTVINGASLVNAGLMEIKGKSMQYSKFFNTNSNNVEASSSKMIKLSGRNGMLLAYSPAFVVSVTSLAFLQDEGLRFTLVTSALAIHFFKRIFEFGDTTLTKVFVGGLAWETPKEVMKEHFDKCGEILEAVIISDKLSGRSKGYGFVTFKDPEAAKKACEDATPVINGRRANCNLASLGARRPRSTSTPPPPQHGPVHNVGPRSVAAPPAGNHVQWYYSPAAAAATPALPYHHPHQQQHHHHLQAAAVPYYGYSPSYIAADHVNYNHKLGYTSGSYMNGHYSQLYLGQPMMGAANTLMPMYPFYHFHQSQTMGLPAHYYSPAATATITTGPALMSKPASIPPNPVCLTAE